MKNLEKYNVLQYLLVMLWALIATDILQVADKTEVLGMLLGLVGIVSVTSFANLRLVIGTVEKIKFSNDDLNKLFDLANTVLNPPAPTTSNVTLNVDRQSMAVPKDAVLVQLKE